MKSKFVSIVDYGVGNIGSVYNMVSKLGFNCIITSDPKVLRDSEKIILPGVGSYDSAIKKLRANGLFDEISYSVLELRKPILGICLGMQLLGDSSKEGILKGFGFLKFRCETFNDLKQSYNLKVPNMGWREVSRLNSSILTNKLYVDSRYYFVHSYYIPNDSYSVLTSYYGVSYCAGLSYENIHGVQFHPEKSHKFGFQIFSNFLE